MNCWWLYLIECKGGGIYVGIAKDVAARYECHKRGMGSHYTRLNPPVRLLASMRYPDRRAATQAELEMKKMSAVAKRQWVLLFGGSSANE